MRYQTSNDQAGTKQSMSTSYKSLVGLTAATATLTRGKIYDILMGTNGTPADNPMEFVCYRTTVSVGTGTAATPSPLDLQDRAAGSVGTVNLTAEPTVGVQLLYIGLNQRASYRWVAAPGSELVYPATNVTGISLAAKSASYTGTSSGTCYHEE